MVVCNLGVLAAERGLSLSKISVETGISRTTLSNLVNHHWEGIQAKTLAALCLYLNVDIGKLFTIYPYELEIKEAWLEDDLETVSFNVEWKQLQRGRRNGLCRGSLLNGDAPGIYDLDISEMPDYMQSVITNLPPVPLRAIKEIFADGARSCIGGIDAVHVTFSLEQSGMPF